MRPLRGLPFDVFEAGAPEAALADAFGVYCSICERPILEHAFVWSVRERRTVPVFAAERPSGPALLLCSTCAAAQAEWPEDREELALPSGPFRSSPFGPFAPFAQFVYRPDVRYGNVVTVSAGGREALATINRFGLDGHALTDPRVGLRTSAWRIATRTTEGLDRRPEDGFSVVTELMAATGFLSVWFTVLWQSRDRQGAAARLLQDAPELLDRFFPGTDWRWLRFTDEHRSS